MSHVWLPGRTTCNPLNWNFGKTLIDWNLINQLEKRIMGTRGAYGFYIDGKTMVTYNHLDSYPSGLGESVVTFIRMCKIDDVLRDRVRNLRGVQEDDGPSAADIFQFRSTTDTSVGENGEKPCWYQLLRKQQGDLTAMLKAGVYIDSKNFLADSLFCEWAFVVNLDSNTLEIYMGFQKEAHAKGRYADWPGTVVRDEYAPVGLVKEIPFDDLPAPGALEQRVSESDVEELARVRA